MKRFLTLLALPFLLLSNVNAEVKYHPDTKKIQWMTGPVGKDDSGRTEQYKFSKDGKILTYMVLEKNKGCVLEMKFDNNIISYVSYQTVTMKFNNGKVSSYSNSSIKTTLDVEWDDDDKMVNLDGTFEGKPSARAYVYGDTITVGNLNLWKEFMDATKLGKQMAMQGLVMKSMLEDQ